MHGALWWLTSRASSAGFQAGHMTPQGICRSERHDVQEIRQALTGRTEDKRHPCVCTALSPQDMPMLQMHPFAWYRIEIVVV